MIPVRGTNTVLKLWEDGGRHASVSRDAGRTWRELQTPETVLNLRFARFDPMLHGEPSIPAGLAAGSDSELHIVQFETPIIEEFKHDLKVLGAQRYQPLPHQGFLVRMDRATAAQVAAKEYVRWVGDFHSAYKLEPEILDMIVSGQQPAPSYYDVVMIDSKKDRARTLAAIQRVGGIAQPDSGMGIMQVATLTLPQVVQLAADNSVQWIGRLGKAETDIDQARIQGGANDLETLTGIDGKGLAGMIMEGVYRTHPEFAARAPYRQAPISVPVGNATAARGTGHGTSTAGEVYARGASPLYKGLTPFSQMLYCNYNWVINTNRRKSVTALGITMGEMYETASWGYSRSTNYGTRSAEMDDIIFDLDIPITQSQSNSGGTPSRPQAWAKNIIAVGAVQHRNTANPLDDGISGASTGPSADGRVKPDLCAYYDAIRTTSGSTGYTTGFGGTSGATPIVNGYAGLTAQMFAEGLFGHPAAPGYQQISAHRSHYTTVKALLINTAYHYAARQLGGWPRARHIQGWGFPDVKNMYDLREKMIAVDEEIVLVQGQARDYLVYVPANTPNFRATMTHRDPPGTSTSLIHRINSVDLRVTAPGGVSYWGNNGMLASHNTSPGGVANDRDTVENVFVPGPVAGVWRVSVQATTIRQDGHPATGVDDTSFALVVSGIAGSRNKDHAILDLDSTGPGNFTVSLTSLPAGWTSGWTVFSATTNGILGNGNFLGVEADGLSVASLLAPVGSMFNFLNTPGVYPNVTFRFPAAVALAVSGLEFDAAAVLFDSSGAVIGVSNTDRVKVQ